MNDVILTGEMASFMFLSLHRDTKAIFHLFYKITKVFSSFRGISVPAPGAQLQGGVWGGHDPALFVGNVICALLVTAFCPHFSKPRRPSLEMIKIAPTVP